MDHRGRRQMISNLQFLVADEGNQDDRAQTLSIMGTILRQFNASTEHDTNVSNFETELTGLSAQATREMLSLAEAQRPTDTATTAPSTAESNSDHDNSVASS